MLEIDKVLSDKYELEVKNIVPYKDSYLITTSSGKKLLKKTLLSEDRVLFIHAIKEYLYKNEFKNIDRYLCTAEDIPFVTAEGSIYTISDVIEGNECNFDNKKDIINASTMLARLHKTSKGFIPPEKSKPRDELGKLPIYFCKRLDEIKKLKKVARKGKTKFDYMFLKHVDYFQNIGENAIEAITNSKYEELVNTARQQGVFCHHDYTHHNIICSGDKYSLINFDFCCFELKVYDLANLLRRKMRKCNWDINEAGIIVNAYNSVESISKDEFLVMKIILQFPQKFWRVVNKYYNSKRSWSERSYIAKLQEVIDEVDWHSKFMDKIDTILS